MLGGRDGEELGEKAGGCLLPKLPRLSLANAHLTLSIAKGSVF